MDLAERISKLSPEQRKLLELKLRKRGMNTSRKPSIEPAEKKEYYPLSSAQKRFFMLQQMDSDKPAYNMPGRMRLEGIVNRDRFEEVLRKIIKRHEALRTSFEIIAGEPFQEVHEDVEFAVEYYTLTSREAEPLIHGFVKPFDLTRPPLLRVSLIKLEEEKHIFLVDMHHIISDGSSLSLFIKEFMALYGGSRLPALTVQYKDFCQWQNQRFSSGELEKQEAYWLNRFSGQLPVLDMPTDYERPSVQSFDGDEVRFSLGKQLTLQLHAFMRQRGLTLFMGLTAIYSVLLSKYTGQEDIIIGSPRAGRDSRELEPLIGLFMETLALRSFPGGGKTCAGFLQEVKGVCLEAFENQAYPFGELLKRVVFGNDPGRNPLFDALLIVQNIEMPVLEVEGLKFTSDAFDSHAAKLDINLVAFEEKDDIRFELKYCTALFKAGTMERFSRHFVNLIKTVVNNPGVPLALLEIMSAEEKRQVLEVFNRVDEGIPATVVLSRQKPVHELFAEQAEKTPDRIAIHRTYRTYMTYKELNRRSNQLASLLIEKGVKSNSIVGIMVQPSVDMFIGILGILKAGGAYLPIEPGYPEERIGYMLKDSGVRILLSEVSEVSEDIEVIDLIKIIGPIGPIGPIANHFPTQTIHPTHLSYIIYTSGSTGKPKGVMVEHRNLTAYLYAFFREFGINAADTVIQLASYCFDVFVEEVFPLLVKGGKIVIPHPSEWMDFDSLSRLILKHRVSIVDCTPLVLNEFNKIGSMREGDHPLESVHTFISGGDTLKEEHVNNLLKIGKVYNTYGPTETTVCATYFRYRGEKGTRIPIGKPVANNKVYILDRNSRVQPVGVAGELCVSGAGVTRGYLNNPELTSEKFFSSSLLRFSASQLLTFSLYRTDDLARWLPDGNIEFLGRKDDQVKIRGFRIELGEIEARLAAHEEIKEAVVLDRQDENGNKYLCAYIVPAERKEDNPFNVPGLRAYLLEQLPDYMIPTHFIELNEIPLTSHGKIDKKSLLALEGDIGTGTEYVPPTDEVEKKLADLWSEILEKDRVGIYDNFFDLGGQSLKAMRLMAMIRESFHVKIPLVSFFEVGTVKGIAGLILENQSQKRPAVHPLQPLPQAATDHSLSGIKFKRKKRKEVEL